MNQTQITIIIISIVILIALANVDATPDPDTKPDPGPAPTPDPTPGPEPVPSSPLDDFVEYEGRACTGRNELGTWDDHIDGCAIACYNNPLCLSFGYSKDGICTSSSSCSADLAVSYADRDLYVKRDTYLDNFKGYPTTACTGRNELGVWSLGPNSLLECAGNCYNNPQCISFEHKDDGKCSHSSSCTSAIATNYSDFSLYERI